MSRIGKMPVVVPQGVEVHLDGRCVTVKGPKGTIARELPANVMVEVAEGAVHVSRASDDRIARSMHGLSRTLIANMVDGVTSGFEKSLEIVGTGYRASKQGENLILQVGYSHTVQIVPAEGINIEVPAPNKITVRGIDKELVGQTAANIRAVREPEVYHGKGIRYAGEHVALKAGKTGKAGS
ncbi:MAG TPA: 50S ribosomal protein L6 [Firmicutes bacterium]|jgi:large subunit ribosomal protein L6|nr:50S ribosomal protein L6 [Bacillota bacterium]HBK60009.1 50S ribosomal protein L6 [Bacillota bacterium]